MSRPDKWPTAIIVRSQPDLWRKQNKLDPTMKKFRLIQPGMMIAGSRFDTIIVSGDVAKDIADKNDRNAALWFRDVIECRLMPGGTIIEL